MNAIYSVLFVFFIIFNLVIYHKIFDVYYFNLQKGCGTELITSMLFAAFETVLFLYIGAYLLLGLGIIIAIVLVVRMIKKYSSKQDSEPEVVSSVNDNNTTDKKQNSSKGNTNTAKSIAKLNDKQTDTEQSKGITTVDEAIENVRKNFGNREKTKAVAYLREVTGITLKEAKDLVDQVYIEKLSDPQSILEGAKDDTTKTIKKDERMFCPYCGERILRTAKFCNFCGKSNSYNG